MTEKRLTPTAIFIVITILLGFALLSLVWEGSVLIKVVVSLVLIGFSILLIRLAKIFDRQLQKGDVKNDEKETTQ